MSSREGPAGSVVFPRFADGPQIATQLFVLRNGTDSTQGTMEFFDENPEPMVVVMRQGSKGV